MEKYRNLFQAGQVCGQFFCFADFAKTDTCGRYGTGSEGLANFGFPSS